MGGPGGSGQFKYSGSAAQLIAFGPADILHSIRNGETVIWTGPIMRADAIDGNGKTTLTTKIGTIHFYWGTSTQNPDPLLESLTIDQGAGPFVAPMPAYRNLIYAVMQNCQFGTQTTPPTLKFELSKFPAHFSLPGRVTRLRVVNDGSGYTSAPSVAFTGGGGSGAAATAQISDEGELTGFTVTNTGTGYTSAPSVVISGGGGSGGTAQAYLFHELDGDCIITEFIYDCMVNTYWGAGRDPLEIDTEAFLAATIQLIAEDIGASPDFDDFIGLREIIGKLNAYMDSVIFFQDGRANLKLIRREDFSGAPVLTEADFTDEPVPQNDGFDETSNFFRLTFTDRANNWEDGVEPYDNPANADIQGQSVNAQLDFPYVTRRSVAKTLVKRMGLKQSKPAFFYQLRLQPAHNDKHPGDVIKLTYAKRGLSEAICRVMEVERTAPDDPEVSMLVMVEHTRDTTFDYIPPEDLFYTPPSLDDDGGAAFEIVSVQPRLQTLPPDLKGTAADGFLVAFNKSNPLLSQAKIYWTWDEVQKEYQQLGTQDQFPNYTQVVCWHRLSPDSWFLRLRFPSADFRDSFAAEVVVAPEWIFVTGHRKVRQAGTPSDSHELAGLWGSKVESGYFEAVDETLHDIEVSAPLYGSEEIKEETIADPANSPTQHMYLGSRDDFFVFVTDSIAFERNLPNAPVNPATGVSPDTDLERLVKVTVANHKNEEELPDVDAVEFDRNDTTMNQGGTYTPDWGERALTTYELFDLVAGQYLLLSTAAAYTELDDIDEALGAIYAGAGSDDEKMLWGPVNETLGAYLTRRDRIYSMTP
jgi:hypothetical protein